MNRQAPGFTRVGGLAALGFATIIVGVNLILTPAGMPAAGANPGEVAAFFRTHGGIVAVSSGLTPIAWVLATLFGAGAVATLRSAERARGEAWSLVGFAGLLLQNATFAGVVAARVALASLDGEPLSAYATLQALHDSAFALNGAFLATALLGLTVAGRRTGLLRRWHGALGLVSAALLLTSSLLAPMLVEGSPAGLLGLAGWLTWVAWIVAYGLALLRRPVAASPMLPR